MTICRSLPASLRLFCLFSCTLIGLCLPLSAEEVISEDFSSGLPSLDWEYYRSSTAYGRIQVISGRMRMDVTTNNNNSLNEAILTVDLEGATAASLSFQQIDTADEETSLPGSFSGHHSADGVAISADGTIWYTVVNANELNTASLTTFNVDLLAERDAIRASYDASFDFSSTFKIKFQQYDNYASPTDGREWDNIVITAELEDPTLYLSADTEFLEGSSSSIPVTLTVGSAPATDLVVNLTGDTFLSLPATVTILAGETSVDFSFSITDDADVQGDRAASITATATDYTSGVHSLTVYDDESPFTVTFALGGKGTRTGGGDIEQLVVWGGSPIYPTIQANSGWQFDGWDTDFSSVTTDLTVTAAYIAFPEILTQPSDTSVEFNTSAQFNVSSVSGDGDPLYYQWYEGESGNASNPIAGADAASFVTPALAADFTCWVRVSSYEGGVDSDSATATVTGIPSQYTVTFNLDGKATHTGGGDLTQAIFEGQAAIEPTLSVDTGWIFYGWDVDFSSILGDVTVTAQYTPGNLVTFELGNYGTLLSGELIQQVAVGSTAIAPEVAADEGWVFVGWDVAYHDVTSAITVTAEYAPADLTAIIEEKFIAIEGNGNQNFGGSVSVCGDTAIIGGLGFNDWSGSAYVYVRENGVWALQSTLTASDAAAGDQFGGAVRISGSTVVVGAYNNDDHGSNSGSAYVFVRENGVWTEQAKLTASDAAAGDQFGGSLSLYDDTLVIGAYRDDVYGTDSGSAYVFVRENDEWTEQAKLLPSALDAGDHGHYGSSVAVYEDTVIVRGGRYGSTGIAHVYVRENGIWEEQAQLTASDASAGDGFGAVSINGDSVVIGVPRDSDNLLYSGSAYVFVRNNGVWSEQAKLTASDAAEWYYFGRSVSISGDTIAVGAHDRDGNDGRVYVFNRKNGIWSENTILTASDGVSSYWGDGYGIPVYINGDLVIVGAAEDDTEMGPASGSAYIYDLSVPPATVTFELGTYGSRVGGGELTQMVPGGRTARAPELSVLDGWSFVGWDRSYHNIHDTLTVTAQYLPEEVVGSLEEAKLLASDGFPGNHFGDSVSLDEDTALIGATSGNEGRGSVYVFVRSKNGWVEEAQLIASDGRDLDYFGSSLSLDGDIAVIGAPTSVIMGFPTENNGRAYVFERKDGVWSEVARLLPGGGNGSKSFGESVSIDGNTVVVGALYEGSNDGAAYVYVCVDGVWVEQAKLVASDGAPGDYFGEAVDIKEETIVVTSFGNGGGAYVYVRDANAWAEEAKLEASDGALGNRFGTSVSFHGDTVLVGAREDDASPGSVYVYVRDNGVWVEQAKLEASSQSGYFGHSVSLYGDSAVVGAYGDNGGSLYLYKRSDSIWTEQAKLRSSDIAVGDRFGWHVSVFGDTVAVGGYFDDGFGGSAYLFDLAAPPATVTFDLGDHGNRIGGGALSQLVKVNTSATAPEFDVSPGWLFDAWNEDFSAVTEDMNVSAQYLVDTIDNDVDGLFDFWERLHFTTIDSVDGTIDSDGDGDTDGDEFKSGSDPMDRSDRFHVMEQAVSPVDGRVTLRFRTNDAVGNRRYRILYTDDLSTTDPWPELPMGVFAPDAGDSTEKTFDAPGDGDAFFFKVEAFIEE